MISHVSRFLLAAVVACGALLSFEHSAFAQSQDENEAAERRAKRQQEIRDAIETLSNLLASRVEQKTGIEALKKELQEAKEEASKKELEEQIKAAQDKLAKTQSQISALATGVRDDSFETRADKPFELQREVVGLAEPFVKMMKEATATTREIEKLNETMSDAKNRQDLARKALERISLLKQALAPVADDEDPRQEPQSERAYLDGQEKTWRKRHQEAEDAAETAEQQLTLRLDEQASTPSGVGQYATGFLRKRGVNLLTALAAFFGVFAFFRLVARGAELFLHRRGIKNNFALRLGGLVYQVATVLVSLFAMLIVLNMLNDWILLGVTSVFAVALAWMGLKMLPAIIEQATLLLDLGAVQEGERVLMSGVPWRVEKLDFYTDLVNPELEGGTFTLPVRELVGLHSRPAAIDEAWFPTRKGDWAELSDGRTGKVVIQTPELVQLVELGGSRITYATSDFIAKTPRNLSAGFRVAVPFGIDYRHQADATDKIPRRLEAHLRQGLEQVFGDDGGVRHVSVDLANAGDSSLNYDAEADVAGKLAHRHEDIEREMVRLLVEACNENDWTIPFPQMVLHRSA